MAIRTEAEARADLARHLGPLNDLFEAAHQDFRENARALAPAMNITTRAMVYRDLIWKQARSYADEGKNGAHLHKKNQLILLGLEGKYLLRVKKLRQGFTVAVSPTLAAEHYDGQRLPEYAEDLFAGCDECTLLYLGWTIPENAPDQIVRYLVCNDSNRDFLWAIPLDEGKPPVPTEEQLPMEGGSGDAPARIRIKSADVKKANG